jgi:flagellar biosynthesis protein FlhF
MQIHRFRGKSLRDALERARAAQGDDALVLTHEKTPAGDVLVAVGNPRPLPGSAAVPEPEPEPGQARVPVPVPDAWPQSRPVTQDPGLADLARRLGATGTSREWTQSIVERVKTSGARGAYAIDVAAEALAASIPIAGSPHVDGTTHVLCFVGPPGSGKTTAVAKLAVKLVKARRRIALVTLEARALGSMRQISTYARLLQIPCVAVKDASELERWLRQSAHCDAVLIDASGRPEHDQALIDGLSLDVERYLVLAADAAPEELLLSAAGTPASAAVITRLDLAQRPAAAVEAAARARLPLAFFSNGPEVGAGLVRATSEACCDLFLRGSLA